MRYKFLIYISHSYAIPIGNPLEAEILQRNDIVKWFSDHEEGAAKLKARDNALTTIEAVIAYEPHIVLTATNNVADFISGLKVQIFHGFNAQKRPSKKNTFSHFRIRGFFDLYCTQGPSTTKMFKLQAKKHPHFEVIETGWSKVDSLFPIVKQDTTATLPIIMIASTFNQRLSLAYNEAVFTEIRRLVAAKKYRFFMVLHPKIPKDVVAKWKRLSCEYFEFFDTTDLIPLYQKATFLFADTTSVIQEFVLQKKPVVAFQNNLQHSYLINVNEAAKIEASFTHALTFPKGILKNIETFILDLHPYFDGKSSKRIVEESIAFLHKDKRYLQLKPWNFIRKYKVRKQLGYFTFKTFRKPYTIPKD